VPVSPEGSDCPTRFVVVGAGRFGAFVLAAAAALPDLACRAVADADAMAAQELAQAHGCATADLAALDDLLASGEVDAVVIATPPGSHALLVRQALDNGVDVFCEKPIATSIADADELVAAADRRGLVIVVDHVLRYNPLLGAIRRIQDAMGWTVARFVFENDAADESLPREHWFWDEATSGGIFIEHGVHFFDAAALFIDEPATAVCAVATSRGGWPAPDLVTATVTHGAALATHTHSFTHAHRAERQLIRIDYGPAEARIRGWIPVDAEIVAFTDPAGRDRLLDLAGEPDLLAQAPGVGDATTTPGVQVIVEPVDGPPTATGRGVEFPASEQVTVRLTLGGGPAKAHVYRAGVMAALQDLHDCRTHRGRRPRSGAETATEALRLAVHATESARLGRSCGIRARTTPTGDLAGRPQ
jgi:predicted dehydrogenase